MKCIGDQIKAFGFFCTASDAKSTKGGSVYIQTDCETMSKKRTDSSFGFTHSAKV